MHQSGSEAVRDEAIYSPTLAAVAPKRPVCSKLRRLDRHWTIQCSKPSEQRKYLGHRANAREVVYPLVPQDISQILAPARDRGAFEMVSCR